MQKCADIKTEGKVSTMVFFDFSAAFNSGNRSDMIRGCERLGVDGKELALIKDFLSDRCMKIKIGNEQSQGRCISAGSPAGSYLGMLMYLANVDDYNDDFPSEATVAAFVDDTTGIMSAMRHEIGYLEEEHGIFALYDAEPIQKVCDAMSDYSNRKGFKLNTKKTKTMVVGGTKQATGSKVLASINNEYLESVDSFKLLGVWLDDEMSFKRHIDELEKKCAKRIWILRNLRQNGVSIQSCVQIYCAQIRSLVDYGAPIYYPNLSKTMLGKLENIQNRSLKMICGFEYSSRLVREICKVQTITERLQKLTDDFVLKEFKEKKTGWFTQRVELSQNLRNRKPINECVHGFDGPINYHRKRLNILLQEENGSKVMNLNEA